jgi:hypothetical protein
MEHLRTNKLEGKREQGSLEMERRKRKIELVCLDSVVEPASQ